MKKNRMLRMASALLVLTLLSTSIIGGTFAKYVTTDSATDTARVAKFGVVASVSGDLFGNAYAKVADGNTIVSHNESGATVNADTSNKDKIVAPGTVNKKGLSFTVAGKPEVSTTVKFGEATDAATGNKYANSDIYLKSGEYGVMVERNKDIVTDDNVGNYFAYDATAGTYSKLTAVPEASSTAPVYELCGTATVDDDDTYYPLTWYVSDEKKTADAASNKGGAQVAFEALQEKFQENGKDKIFAPNTDLGATSQALSATVGWEWKFEDGADDAAKAATNAKDTILGDMIAAALDTSAAPLYTVVLKDGDNYKKVNYKTDFKDSTDTANEITVAYTGNDATTDNICACLTASFNASITVEQVD